MDDNLDEERTATELDDEIAVTPPAPPQLEERLRATEEVIVTMLGL